MIFVISSPPPPRVLFSEFEAAPVVATVDSENRERSLSWKLASLVLETITSRLLLVEACVTRITRVCVESPVVVVAVVVAIAGCQRVCVSVEIVEQKMELSLSVCVENEGRAFRCGCCRSCTNSRNLSVRLEERTEGGTTLRDDDDDDDGCCCHHVPDMLGRDHRPK